MAFAALTASSNNLADSSILPDRGRTWARKERACDLVELPSIV